MARGRRLGVASLPEMRGLDVRMRRDAGLRCLREIGAIMSMNANARPTPSVLTGGSAGQRSAKHGRAALSQLKRRDNKLRSTPIADNLLSVDEASRTLGVSRSTLLVRAPERPYCERQARRTSSRVLAGGAAHERRRA